jgi:hypothetical protein
MPPAPPAPPVSGVLVAVLAAVLAVGLSGCDLTAPAPVPTTLVVTPGAVELDALDAALPLRALVRDQAGATLPGVRPEWSSEDPSVVSISASGRVQAHAEGTTRIRARLGEAEGWAEVEVRQRAGGAELLSGEEQEARAGTLLPEPLVFRVTDRLGNPWADRPVTFDLPLGGSVIPTSATTGPDGTVQVAWTLGPEPGLQSLTVEADGRRFHLLASATDADGRVPFRIRVQPHGALSPAVQEAVAGAVARWERVLDGKLPPVLVRVPEGRCGDDAPALDQVVDDLLVLVTEGPLDGPGGSLAFASPCFIRAEGLLPIVGRVFVDEVDVPTLVGMGLLEDVLAHEIGHVLGIGPLWSLFELLRNPSLPLSSGAETHFAGPRAGSAFDALGGSAWPVPPVPVENLLGGEGSRDVHWRQSVLFDELMTTLLVPGRPNPLSRISVASLADLGYQVFEDRGEPYSVPAPGTALLDPDAPPPLRIHHLNRILPVHVLDGDGRILLTTPGSP